MDYLDHASYHSSREKHLHPECRFCNPKTLLDSVEGARKAQQLYDMKNNVQLEMDLDPQED